MKKIVPLFCFCLALGCLNSGCSESVPLTAFIPFFVKDDAPKTQQSAPAPAVAPSNGVAPMPGIPSNSANT